MAGIKSNCSSGFSLLEVLIALLVFTIGILGIVSMNIYSVKSNAAAGNITRGVEIASAAIERLMIVDYESSVLNEGDNKDFSLIPGGDDNLDGDFNGVFDVKNINNSVLGDSKEVSVRVRWNHNKKSVELKFIRTKDE